MFQREFDLTDPFTGVGTKKKYYFQLTRLDTVELNVQQDLNEIAEARDGQQVLTALKRMVAASVGVNMGGKFVKNELIRDEFMASEAYGDLVFWLIDGANEDNPAASKRVAAFVNGIIPAGYNTEEETEQANEPNVISAEEL